MASVFGLILTLYGAVGFWGLCRLADYHAKLRMMKNLRDSLNARIATRLDAKVGGALNSPPFPRDCNKLGLVWWLVSTYDASVWTL